MLIHALPFFQPNAMAAVALAFISPFIAECDSRSRLLDEDAALDLLHRTFKCDSIYEKRISADCIAYGTEETTNACFGFVLREIHNAKCGGAPDVTPSIDRYRGLSTFRQNHAVESG